MPPLYCSAATLALSLLAAAPSWALFVSPTTVRSSTSLLRMVAGKGFAKNTQAVQEEEAPHPLSVEQRLAHIPVYAVTDSQGNGQAISVGGDKKPAFCFFLSPVLADAFLARLAPGCPPGKELTVSGLFLGKVWSSFLQDTNEDDDVEYRLVPDPRDLITAETILRMEDNQQTKEAPTQKLAPYNVVPLFGVRQKARKQRNKNKNHKKLNQLLDRMVSSHYLYFGSQHRLDASSQHENEEDELVFLHDVVERMQDDYRNVVLVPHAPITEGTVTDAALAQQLANPDSFVAQNYLMPLFE